MDIKDELLKRSENKCELCGGADNLRPYMVPPKTDGYVQDHVIACSTCTEQINDPDKMDTNHWRCLNDSMWSEVPAVQVVAWRMLNRMKSEGWPQDLLDMMYLDEETNTWAKAGQYDNAIKHVDSNGVTLEAGDNVVLIKDLEVKGANFTAKRGTPVRSIRLVQDNPEHIEGKVNGQGIVILTKYVKKS